MDYYYIAYFQKNQYFLKKIFCIFRLDKIVHSLTRIKIISSHTWVLRFAFLRRAALDAGPYISSISHLNAYLPPPLQLGRSNPLIPTPYLLIPNKKKTCLSASRFFVIKLI